MLSHASVNIKQETVWMILAVATILDCELRSQDVLQAYLQNHVFLNQDIYVVSEQGFYFNKIKLLKFLKPLHPLTDNGDYRHMTMRCHLKKKPGLKPLARDLACFTKTTQRELSGLVGT